MSAYVIQRLDGYTNGKPSWLRWSRLRLTKEEAVATVERYRTEYPGGKFRVRKARAKR